jgi:hypothetical protein
MRKWIADVLRNRPGMHTVRGRVVDAAGRGVAGVRVQCGNWHWAITAADGSYAIPSLVAGTRELMAAKSGLVFTPASHRVVVKDSDVRAPDFTAGPAANR